VIDLKRSRLVAAALAAVFVATACGGPGATPGGSAAPATTGTGASGSPGGAPLSGEISITGSSTVQPISQGVQEAFNATQPDVAIAVNGPGTGDGFKQFCADEADITGASRAIRDDENEKGACEAAGIGYVELKVAIDGLSILTAKDNAAVTCLSYADLYALIGPESQGFDDWSDAQAMATELGSTTPLPDAALTISGPGEESGTYDYFVEEVIGEFAEDRGQEEQTRADYDSNPNDNVIIEGIGGSPTSLGWVGYAFAVEAANTVKLLEVSAPDGECVAPTPETIASGDYPLARDLYIYVNKARAEENPAVTAFVDFYLAEGTVSKVNEEVGYIDLDATVLAESRSAWEGR
jgi:phosphate transport system substrate-binding protein